MVIKHVNGDILNAPEYYKVHQVNCQGVMGSGIALQVKRQFPSVFESYRELYKSCNNKAIELLGFPQICPINNGAIVNLHAQDKFGTDKRQTNYEAFYVGLENLKMQIETISSNQKSIAFPYKIGSARGGADWNVIYAMIISVFEKTDFTITIYHYNE